MSDAPDTSEIAADECVCGQLATTVVEVQWADARRRYRYCDDCAEAVVDTIEGAEVVQ